MLLLWYYVFMVLRFLANMVSEVNKTELFTVKRNIVLEHYNTTFFPVNVLLCWRKKEIYGYIACVTK